MIRRKNMLETLKKRSFKTSLILSVILIIAGIFVIATSFPDTLAAVSGYETFEDLEPDEIRNQLVEIDVTANFGCYMEEYSENTSTHRRTTTDLYYVIWTGDDYATDFRYMSIKVPVRYEDEMEEIAENTYNEMRSAPLHLVGKIRKLSSEEYEYFEEYFSEAGWSAAEIEEVTLPYYIDVTGSSVANSNTGVYILLCLLGVFFIAFAIFRIVKASRGGYLKKFRKAYEDAGYSESSIESDLASATSYNKKGTIKIGRLCTYYDLSSTVPKAIANNKILWAYQNTTTHRTNGIKTGVTYSVVIFADGEKTGYTIGVPNEATAQEMLQKMNAMLPWVVVGYSEDLRKLFNKDRAHFLELRYNKVAHVAVEPGFEGINDSYNTGSEQ